jgi:Cd2+/Zn2+-exporting ATPase
LAAHAEAFSLHPIAASIREAFEASGDDAVIDQSRVTDVEEIAGQGVSARVDGVHVLVGNRLLMKGIAGLPAQDPEGIGTLLFVACDGAYAGHLLIGDSLKPDALDAIGGLKAAGARTIMLTGDRKDVAAAVARELNIEDYRAELLPQDKVAAVEEFLVAKDPNDKHTLAFVGDGINDAPALMRADVGIAMGALGSDAAIEAADVVLMDDAPSKIATAIRIAKRTMRIVWQNIVFALGVKIAILVLAVFGIANLWLAVFGDVGVAVLAILNAMRALHVERA